MISNLNLGGKYLTRVGKRLCQIKAVAKTVKGRFGPERFAQHSKQGVLRWWCLSGRAFLLSPFQNLDLPLSVPGSWPDWGSLARTVRPQGHNSYASCAGSEQLPACSVVIVGISIMRLTHTQLHI